MKAEIWKKKKNLITIKTNVSADRLKLKECGDDLQETDAVASLQKFVHETKPHRNVCGEKNVAAWGLPTVCDSSVIGRF